MEYTFLKSKVDKKGNKSLIMEYRGYIIERESIGKYGTSFQYRCGKFIAPRKKDVTQHIDQLLEKKLRLDIELNQLEKFKPK